MFVFKQKKKKIENSPNDFRFVRTRSSHRETSRFHYLCFNVIRGGWLFAGSIVTTRLPFTYSVYCFMRTVTRGKGSCERVTGIHRVYFAPRIRARGMLTEYTDECLQRESNWTLGTGLWWVIVRPCTDAFNLLHILRIELIRVDRFHVSKQFHRMTMNEPRND